MSGAGRGATSLLDTVPAAVLSSSSSISAASPCFSGILADFGHLGDALTADQKKSGLSRASSRASLLLVSSFASKVAHMAQTGEININSIQISIETELEMEDPMQIKTFLLPTRCYSQYYSRAFHRTSRAGQGPTEMTNKVLAGKSLNGRNTFSAE